MEKKGKKKFAMKKEKDEIENPSLSSFTSPKYFKRIKEGKTSFSKSEKKKIKNPKLRILNNEDEKQRIFKMKKKKKREGERKRERERERERERKREREG